VRPDFSSATFFVGLNMGAANPPSAAAAAMARCHSRQLAEPRRMGSLGNVFSDDMGVVCGDVCGKEGFRGCRRSSR